ncbi:hypothetical protein NHX12_025753 [Muraenolepis orangiensis]|uniref:Zinc finger protein 292 n=1 Tax=Muraenolepis orangiensis TaxID=630683 RepID=A0A9Q0EH95_9TELE|nr:hypothetical protein NHX12_025753 [Muraenolepis orangiensis]
MADEEEPELRDTSGVVMTTIEALRRRLDELQEALVRDPVGPVRDPVGPVRSARFCQDFCRTLLEYAGCWKVEDDPLPLVEVYTVALLAYSRATAVLSPQCDNVPLVLDRLALSFIELLLSLKEELPAGFWEEVRSSVQGANAQLQDSGIPQMDLLCSLTQQSGVWTNTVLQGLLSQGTQQQEQGETTLEGPVLLEMRLKQLMKDGGRLKEAALLARSCAEHPSFQGKGHFRQTHLVCLCSTAERDQLMEELSKVDCRDALDMICNLESEGEERAAFSLCSAFLTHQLLQADTYCAWELTLFWSKLLKRLESSEQDFLDRCRKMSILSKTVFHILFLIKVVQSEMGDAGLPTCIEMCIRALQLESIDRTAKATICKTLSCLLPTDLEVKRACQLTEFLLEPTVDAYYAVESLYNEPDQKFEEENMPVPNSLRCELLLVFKTQWPFDPEFWDWRALKRQCLALMGEEASIVSSIDLLNDNEDLEVSGKKKGQRGGHPAQEDLRDLTTRFMDTTNELNEITDRLQKNREIKKLRKKGFVSARFRNFQAYMQYCVLCDKEFLGHRIVRHAQTHFKAGVYSCPICAETFTSKDTLVPHVASHVKQSSKERLTAMKTNRKLANPKTAAPVIAALKAKSENYLHTNGDSQGQSGGSSRTAQTELSRFQVESPEENVCPVSSCKKSFKFLKNLLAHVNAHGDEEAKRFLEMQSNKVVCHYCCRQFVNVTHLNDHLQVHCGVNPYICIHLNCKACFQSNPELLVHRKNHNVFKARCMFPNCGMVFNEAFKLYDHEAQHYKTFTCKVPDCGKIFHSLAQLELHQDEHATQTTPEEHQIPQQNSQLNSQQNPQQNSEQTPQLNLEQIPQQNMQHNSQNSGPSLIERMLTDSPSSSLEMSHESKDFSCANDCGRESLPSNSKVSLLASPRRLAHDYRQYAVKSECQDTPLSSVSHTQGLDTKFIQSSVNSHFTSLPNRPMTSPESHSFDNLRAALQSRGTPSFESPNGGLHTSHTNLLEDHTPMTSPTRSSGSIMYSSNCNVTYPQQLPPTCTNMLLTTPSDNGIPLGMGLPLSATPLPPSGIRAGNAAPYPVNPLAPSAEKRHHCAFVNCTRNYSSYRSVTKHMRAVHPEFYEQWKNAKRNAKNPPTMLLGVGSTRPEGPSQSMASTAADPTAFTASGFAQADLPEMGTEDDILKQIMAEANMTDLFDQASVPPPFFQGTYGGVEGTPQSSVIQHTGNLHVKKEDQFYPGPYLQSNIPPYSIPSFPDPELSQIRSENQHPRPHPPSLPVAVRTNQRTDIISNAAKQQLSIGQHSLAPSCVNQGERQRHTEQDVKKRLREQILSGEFIQRSSHSVNAKTSVNSKSHGSFSSTGSPSNIGVLHRSTSELRPIASKNSMTPSLFPSGCPSSSNTLTAFRGSSSQQGGTPTLTNMVKHIKPEPLSGVHRPWGHSACGISETIGEVNENVRTSVKQEDENIACGTGPTNNDPHTLSGFVKPFACDGENCTFRSMSSDVLWKHMVRVHNSTLERINEAKQKNAKLAPFVCHKCNKTFTRNSNRRVHYQTAHRMSIEEISQLHITPTLTHVVPSPSNQNPTGAVQSATTSRTSTNESISLQDPSKYQHPFEQHSSKCVIQQNSYSDNQFPQVHRHPSTQASTVNNQLPPQTVSGSNWSDGQHSAERPVPTMPTGYSNRADQQSRLNLQSVAAPPGSLPSVPRTSIITLDQSQITKQTSASSVASPISEVYKSKGKKSNAAFNPYRPYCCVHEGCTAAFTIQHNLILHYRAIHQSALSVLEVKKEQDGTEAAYESREHEQEEEMADSDNEIIPEFRCQEKDCCGVFQEVPGLLQHYLQLHEFSLDKAGAILSRINLSRFACDQQGCVAMFTTFWKYVGHIKEVHGGVTLSRHETLNGFSCDVEDCDRTYATKYNLLRHTMKKHPEIYQQNVINQPIPEECAKQNSKNSHNSHYPIVKANNGKENIESNKKLQKGSENKRLEKTQKNNWTKYGKPALKSKGEASAMCTKKFTLQYPCMLMGCDSVMRSERSIMKHYMGHGLSERYLEEQRSHFIFCKKLSRYKHRSNRSDDSKSDNSSDLSDDDLVADTGLGGSGYGSAKPGLRKRAAMEMSSGFFDGSLSIEDTDSEEPIVVKRKRGRPRKLAGNMAKPRPKPRSTRSTRIVYSAADEETDSCDSSAYLALTPDDGTQLSDTLTSFKPMGFEVSFLKFLEHSKTPPHVRSRGRPPGKKSSLHTKDTCVEFSNRQNLESLGKVKILVDRAYSVVGTLLLKQLQDMRPTVILEKND